TQLGESIRLQAHRGDAESAEVFLEKILADLRDSAVRFCLGVRYAAMRTRATVMLSMPPLALASSTSCWQAFCSSLSLLRISAIRSSVTMPVSPSQHTRQTSPG